jgi:hypothetical protein
MAKRYITTDLFAEDWFLEMSADVKLFWIYSFLTCDHAGFLKANIRPFNALNGTSITLDTALNEINAEKVRIMRVSERVLYLTGFVDFQYGNVLNPSNRVHKSVIDLHVEHNITLDKSVVNKAPCMGNDSPLEGVKDKDKDKDIDKVDFTKNALAETPTVEQVVEQFRSIMASVGMDATMLGGCEKLGATFHAHYESQGWVKGNGMAIYKWKPMVSEWIAKEKGRQISNPKNGEKPKAQRSWD